jgi:hypothetical protein
MKVNYATFERKASPLSEQFGYDWACKLFGQETVDALPRYVRGKHAGQPKGFVIWLNCPVGGWCRNIGGVLKPGLARAWLGPHLWASQEEALRGPWLGRVQPICGDKMYLFEEGRAAEMQRQAAARAEQAAIWAEQADQHETLAASLESSPHTAHMASASRERAALCRAHAESMK